MNRFSHNELVIANSFFDPLNKILNSSVKAGQSGSGKVLASLTMVSDAHDQMKVAGSHHQRGPGVTLIKVQSVNFQFFEIIIFFYFFYILFLEALSIILRRFFSLFKESVFQKILLRYKPNMGSWGLFLLITILTYSQLYQFKGLKIFSFCFS